MTNTFTIDGRSATEAEARASFRARDAFHLPGLLPAVSTATFDAAMAGDAGRREFIADMGIVITGEA